MIRRELPIFLVVGILTVLIDFLTYRGLIWVQLFGVDIAKGIGFLVGTLFAYFANRFWTFSHKDHADGSIWRFIVIYSISLVVNVYVNSLLINWLPSNMPILSDVAILVEEFISIHDAINTDVKRIISSLFNKDEAVIQIAYIVATVTSATLNFIGMKIFVFRSKIMPG
jgi:putative flippase GtrA